MDKESDVIKDTVMLYNSTPGIWLFPDGEIITRYYEAQQKADKLGMKLEQPKLTSLYTSPQRLC